MDVKGKAEIWQDIAVFPGCPLTASAPYAILYVSKHPHSGPTRTKAAIGGRRRLSMFCRRCQYDLPDGTEVCPVCGTMTRRKARRRNAPLKFLIRYLDILTMLSLLLHAFVWATGAHFVIDGSIGLIDARKYLYLAHKGLSAVDLAFAALISAL